MQGLRFSGDYFSLHPSTAADDYQQLHDLCHCCRQSHSPFNHSWSISLQKERRQVRGEVPLPSAACAMGAVKMDSQLV